MLVWVPSHRWAYLAVRRGAGALAEEARVRLPPRHQSLDHLRADRGTPPRRLVKVVHLMVDGKWQSFSGPRKKFGSAPVALQTESRRCFSIKLAHRQRWRARGRGRVAHEGRAHERAAARFAARATARRRTAVRAARAAGAAAPRNILPIT